jgi:hypothetical protein
MVDPTRIIETACQHSTLHTIDVANMAERRGFGHFLTPLSFLLTDVPTTPHQFVDRWAIIQSIILALSNHASPTQKMGQ